MRGERVRGVDEVSMRTGELGAEIGRGRNLRISNVMRRFRARPVALDALSSGRGSV